MPAARPEDEVAAGYRRRHDRHAASSEVARVAARRDGWARLAVFVATSTAAYLLSSRTSSQAAPIAVGAVGLVVFCVFVALHRRHEAVARHERALAIECAHGIARVHRDWSSLPSPIASGELAGHAFADDLDVFGNASLARIVGPTGPITGRPVMQEWLASEVPPVIEQLAERQAAVAELAPRVEWREALAVGSKAAGRSWEELDRFLTWAEESCVAVPPAVHWAAGALTVATILLAARALLEHASWGPFVLIIVVNLAFTGLWAARLSRALRPILSRGFDWLAVSRMLEHVGTVTFTAPLLRDLRDRAEPERVGALRALDAISSCAETRYSPLGYATLQALTLWDFHVVAALARWRRAHGTSIRARLRAVGEIEALAALSVLQFDNPTWTYPRFQAGGTTIEAEALAHPLLPATARVGNDVTVGPRGTFLLITGSNMAGKSTLLRTIGLNVVLAQLGAPVCAASFSLPRVRVHTVMHVRDSIASGTSLFLAELLRIREVVVAAHDTTGPPLLYLADEILHGTNADDRRIAICAILSDLIESGAIGAMATHLVGLENDPSLAAHARAVHFTEQYAETPSGLAMRFDYRLRPGPATTRNAIRLLESMGLRRPS